MKFKKAAKKRVIHRNSHSSEILKPAFLSKKNFDDKENLKYISCRKGHKSTASEILFESHKYG